MTVMELGALGEFLGVFALVATLIYLSIQVRHARSESEKAVLEARTTGVRDLYLNLATSEGLSAAMVKAQEAIGDVPTAFQTELISFGLGRQEAERVSRWLVAQQRHDITTYETATPAQRNTQTGRLRMVYSSGLGRLFWEHSFARDAPSPFTTHVNQLIAEADQQQEAQQ